MVAGLGSLTERERCRLGEEDLCGDLEPSLQPDGAGRGDEGPSDRTDIEEQVFPGEGYYGRLRTWLKTHSRFLLCARASVSYLSVPKNTPGCCGREKLQVAKG